MYYNVYTSTIHSEEVGMKQLKLLTKSHEQPVFGLLERISIVALVIVATLFTMG